MVVVVVAVDVGACAGVGIRMYVEGDKEIMVAGKW